MTISRDSRLRRSDQVVSRELTPGEGAVLLHLETAQYFGLNPVGLLVWDALAEERTAGELVDHVRSRVADPPDRLEADVLAFLESARERGVVDVV